MTNCFSIKKTLNFDFNLGLDHKKKWYTKRKKYAWREGIFDMIFVWVSNFLIYYIWEYFDIFI
jgi:hypothetical protein